MRLIGTSASRYRILSLLFFFPQAPQVSQLNRRLNLLPRRPELSIATAGYIFFAPVVEKCKICLLSIAPTDKKIKDCRHGVTKEARTGYGTGVWV